jgi:hypothetical protein
VGLDPVQLSPGAGGTSTGMTSTSTGMTSTSTGMTSTSTGMTSTSTGMTSTSTGMTSTSTGMTSTSTGMTSTSTGMTSTSTGMTSTSTGMTSTTTSTTSTGTGGAATSTTTGVGGGDAGTCVKPGTLHPPKLDAGPGTLYCPFSSVDGGPNEYCTPGTQHCCESPSGATPSSCVDSSTACMIGYVDWQCEDPVADCPSGQVCCAPGATIGFGGPGCGNFAHTFTHTACVAAGACPNAGNMGNILLCTSSAECPAVTPTCTPFSVHGNQVGGCL